MSRDTVPKLPSSHGAFPAKSCLPQKKRVLRSFKEMSECRSTEDDASEDKCVSVKSI
jgi:hypothetical protein